ncbi:phosphatase PAP2 family protein [Anditalea andensis]|uniref:Phosphoesterase n=1 Tax=Anditalea andensis TaxID=1048983 RepID=A0A074KVF8_9BACT|nr:phosphatase PAP2 family protein [Anditalea andensis]KEO72924.1 phosphoesterase [Anditalea andensis]
MKNSFTFYTGISFALMFLFSCSEEELPSYFKFNDYEFASLDENGGLWSPVLLEDVNQIYIAKPTETTSLAYKAELNASKEAISKLTAHQRDIISYWSNNPIVRWNEIGLELAAKYNLIPGPNPDGTYTLPDPNNPGAKPYFPFAHPPYASRAFAYLSVAQLDGLITAWHYKYLYNRPSPYVSDPSIVFAYHKNELPSYPSDGAVLAITSRDILSAMFPLEKEYLSKLAEEHLQSLIWAGVNVQSDLEAGKIIGTEVARMALIRASTDGMKNAQTSKHVSDSIKNAAFEGFGWAWENMETPKRLVGLTPLFGKVKMWNVPTVEEVRPASPPALNSPQFMKDVEELKRYSKNLTSEQRKIANWWQDGLGTYTPPGHWNRFAKESIVKYKLNPIRSARVFAYMNMAIVDAGISCWDTKYYYHYPRPIQAIPGFKTILGTPNFPAYTSGHSTFSGAAAEVLSYFFPAEEAKYRKWAQEAADSRVYGGIHYRFDSEVGLDQGKKIGAYAVIRAKYDGAN